MSSYRCPVYVSPHPYVDLSALPAVIPAGAEVVFALPPVVATLMRIPTPILGAEEAMVVSAPVTAPEVVLTMDADTPKAAMEHAAATLLPHLCAAYQRAVAVVAQAEQAHGGALAAPPPSLVRAFADPFDR